MLTQSCVRLAGILALGTFLIAGLQAADDEPKPITGIGPTGKIVKLHTGFKFTEGPAADRNGNVYFSRHPQRAHPQGRQQGQAIDLPREVQPRQRPDGQRQGRDRRLRNGRPRRRHQPRRQGRARRGRTSTTASASMPPTTWSSTRRAASTSPTRPWRCPTPAAAGQDGRLLRCARRQGDSPDRRPDAAQRRHVSPDEKTLYVIPTGPGRDDGLSVEVAGQDSARAVFCTLKGKDGKPGTGGDGCTMDTKGNLYITSTIGIQVFDPEASSSAHRLPGAAGQRQFGGKDRKTLYVTARTSLYTVPMEATGHVFPAGGK